jgi:hypothetical protein
MRTILVKEDLLGKIFKTYEDCPDSFSELIAGIGHCDDYRNCEECWLAHLRADESTLRSEPKEKTNGS